MVISELVVTIRDKGRLLDSIYRARAERRIDAPLLDALQSALRRAEMVSHREVHSDVITMNSRFELTDLRTDEVENYTLVYPEDARAGRWHISVLSQAGIAFLGTRVGDVVRWIDGGARRRVTRTSGIVYQPEASGDYKA